MTEKRGLIKRGGWLGENRGKIMRREWVRLFKQHTSQLSKVANQKAAFVAKTFIQYYGIDVSENQNLYCISKPAATILLCLKVHLEIVVIKHRSIISSAACYLKIYMDPLAFLK